MSSFNLYGKLFVLSSACTGRIFGLSDDPTHYTLDGALDMWGDEALEAALNVLQVGRNHVDSDGDTWTRVQ